MNVVADKSATAGAGLAKRKRVRDMLTNVVPFLVFLVAYIVVPRYAQDSQLTTLIYIGINVLLVLGLNLLMGYAGQISLGHAAFFGMGAYTSAILTLRPIPQEVIPGFSIGVGVMAGCAALISLTKVTGWRLAAGIGVLLSVSWIAGRVHLPLAAAIPIYGLAMAGLGVLAKTGWLKTGAAGVICGAVVALCDWFLAGTLARGGTSPWTAMVVGVFFTGLVAYLLAGQVLRLKGHYLGMATLGFGIIVEIIFRQWTAVTGGSSDGIFGIPSIQPIDELPKVLRHVFEGIVGGAVDPRRQYFYLVWGFVLIALLVSVNIVRSRVGRAFRAVHGSETAAESLGVDTGRYKVQVFVLSAAFASLAGSLHAHNAGIGYINPSEFSFMASVQLVVMVVVGGMASVWGSLFGAAAIQLLKNWLLTLDKANHQVLGLTLKGLDPIVFGAVLIGVMIVLPQGLVRGVTDGIAASWRATLKTRKKKTE